MLNYYDIGNSGGDIGGNNDEVDDVYGNVVGAGSVSFDPCVSL